MNETTMTVRGTVVTNPITRRVGDDQVFTFRVASNTRFLDRNTGEWRTAGTLYMQANCWGRIGQRAPGVICKGDGVIVAGRVQTNEYEKDGVVHRDLEMRVNGLGPDLARMDVTVRRSEPHDDAGLRGMDAVDADEPHPMELGSHDVEEPADDDLVGADAG